MRKSRPIESIKLLAERHWVALAFCLLCTFCLFFFWSYQTSPLYVWVGYDDSVFDLMGLAILKGRTPYLDLFDHKGPILYFINALGQWLIPGKLGIFVLQVLLTTLSAYMWYLIGRHFISPLKSLAVVLLCLFSYYAMATGCFGNLTEDWNVFFITLSFYCLIVYCYDQPQSQCWLFITIGICLACSFFIRPNDAVAFIGAPIIGVLFLWHQTKNYSAILPNCLWMCLGFVMVLVPILIYFIAHNAISDFWYGLVGYNSLYSNGLVCMIEECISLNKYIYLPIILVTCILVYRADKKMFYLALPSMLLGYVFLGARCYSHYFIVWVPIIMLLYWIFMLKEPQKSIVLLGLIIFFTMPCFSSTNILKLPLRMYKEVRYAYNSNSIQTQQYNRAQALFAELTDDDKEQIWNYNLSWDDTCKTFDILWKCEIVPCNRVPMVFLADIDSTLYRDMNLVAESPKFVLYSIRDRKPISYELTDSVFIANNYEVLSSSHNPDLILYRRKEN